MATHNSNLTFTATITDAEFRAFCTALCATFESGGHLLVADSADGDHTTATFPGVNNTVSFYQIRRFSDTLQGSAPVYIKWEFGRGAGAGIISVWWTIGTGSDGAGNITGTRQARFQITPLTGTYTAQPIWVAAGTNWLTVTHINSTTNGMFLGIQRTNDTTGAETSEGLILQTKTYTSGAGGWVTTTPCRAVILFTGVNPANEVGSSSGPCINPANQSTGAAGSGDIIPYPALYYGVGKIYPPPVSWWGGFNADHTSGNVYTYNIYGTNHDFLQIQSGNINAGYTGLGTLGILARYE